MILSAKIPDNIVLMKINIKKYKKLWPFLLVLIVKDIKTSAKINERTIAEQYAQSVLLNNDRRQTIKSMNPIAIYSFWSDFGSFIFLYSFFVFF